MKTHLFLAPFTLALIGAGVIATASPARAAEYGAATRRVAASGIVAPRAGAWCAEQCDAVVTDWSLAAYQVIRAGDGYGDPMAASRSLAMVHLAMHDAVNAVQPRYRRYALGTVPAYAGKADAAVAAVTAAHDVLVALYPQAAAVAVAKAQLDRSLFDAGVGPAVEAGKQLGEAAAAAVLLKRTGDGSTNREAYTEGTQPGQYRFTTPYNFAAAPHWRQVIPFALTGAAQFRTAPPPALDGEAYRRDFEEVKRYGDKRSAWRSADETHYAAFWYEFSDIGWNRIARAASAQVKQNLWDRARTFALLNVAMADAYIAGWDSKYHHNSWRPVTAIHLAAQDGNVQTVADKHFETLLPTPPVPDLPSTHSALGMAAATVLAQAYGRDDVSFSFASGSALPANPVRSFTSFSQAAIENADSRVKAGLHFRFATVAGLEMGRRIGLHVNRHALQPDHQSVELADSKPSLILRGEAHASTTGGEHEQSTCPLGHIAG